MEEGYINLSDSFETLLRYLYGEQNFRYDTGLKNCTEWKLRLIKIINSIELSIDRTIEISDRNHKAQLLSICRITKEEISEANNLNDLNEKTILGLIKLIFYLIGDRPDHFGLQKVNKPDHWKLNSHRQIMYYQNNEQKVRLIIDQAPQIDEWNDGVYNRNILIVKLNRELKGDHAKFLDWYKDEYPDKYYEFY